MLVPKVYKVHSSQHQDFKEMSDESLPYFIQRSGYKITYYHVNESVGEYVVGMVDRLIFSSKWNPEGNFYIISPVA